MAWILFPLYSLKIVEPDAWLEDPLFGDATLVSRSALQKHLGPDNSPLLSHGKLSDALGSEAIASVGLPLTQLVEIEPLSYIAVRDVGDNSKNVRRATEIRALLSATLLLRAARLLDEESQMGLQRVAAEVGLALFGAAFAEPSGV